MSTWLDEYLSALQERDRKEKANNVFYDACSWEVVSQYFGPDIDWTQTLD